MNQKDRLFLHPDWGRKNNRYAKTHETNTFGYAYSSQKQPDCHDALTSGKFTIEVQVVKSVNFSFV